MDRGVRETIESILVAIILALLFRAYEAEAFIIPTGSMAPTLQGRHQDVACEKCSYRYRTGASNENPDSGNYGLINETTCPICHYTMLLNEEKDSNDRSFAGDRIIVNKFAYDIAEPQRWDVIVFKFPGNAKQTYIKRLVGLPGEHLLVEKGDIYVSQDKGQTFEIARKMRPRKLQAILQVVDDTHYIAPQLKEVDWPSRWQEWFIDDSSRQWETEDSGEHPVFTLKPNESEPAWLGYRHVAPHFFEWPAIESGELPERLDTFKGALITDYYAYNDYEVDHGPRLARTPRSPFGLHWVGDLATEATIEVKSSQGTLMLDLVEAEVHFTCEIDVATGKAKLNASDDVIKFGDSGSEEGPQANTALRGAGRYQLRFANVDDQLTLWVNNSVVEFDGATTYDRASTDPVTPFWSTSDPGDAEPVRVGGRGIDLEVSHLKVLRDKYYNAVHYDKRPYGNDYGRFNSDSFIFDGMKFDSGSHARLIQYIMESPETWRGGGERLFELRDRSRTDDVFVLEQDQFFPMGDNSPQSSDARLWSSPPTMFGPYVPPYVEREYLIGKALFVYWPHSWNSPPLMPNFRRMGFIR